MLGTVAKFGLIFPLKHERSSFIDDLRVLVWDCLNA